MTSRLRPRHPIAAIIRLAGLLIAGATMSAAGLDDATLDSVINGFETRQSQSLQRQMFTPFPGYSTVAADSNYAWNRLNFALAALYQYRNNPSAHTNFINAANRAILDAANQYLQAGQNSITRRDGGLHWHGNHWIRLHETFGSDSRFYPGLLSADAEAAIRQLIWIWVSNMVTLDDADVSINSTWRIRESENHSAMKDQLAWGGAKILRRFEPYKSMLYHDGSTAEQQFHAWTRFIIQYLRERGRRGLFVEYRSNTYVKYTQQGLYNYFDLSDNPTLRELSRAVLDLMWADAALETIDGFVGGASARQQRPTDLQAIRSAFSALGWFYYGVGQEFSLHPGHMMLLVSDYRIPRVVMDIALDSANRGSYEFVSRRPGLSQPGTENSYALSNRYFVNYADSQILRYSYVTADFVLGTHIFPNFDNSKWTNISSQNRFHSAMMRSGSGFVQIIPQARATGNLERGLNELWATQRKGTQISQKLRTAQNVAEMRVYIQSANTVQIEESGGWIFVNTGPVYAGVRVATGGYQWQDADWIQLNDEYSPVILEVAHAADYDSFADFKHAALGTPVAVVGNNGQRRLQYTGLGGSGEFVFDIDGDDLPTIDGEPWDLSPDYTYLSPFVNGGWPADKVHINKGERSLTLDFELNLPHPAELPPQWKNAAHFDRSWYYLDNFGWFVALPDGWLYHYKLGMIYSPPAEADSLWLYHAGSMQWIWTTAAFERYLTASGEPFIPAAH